MEDKKKYKILLCEDDSNLGLVLKNYLELDEYEVSLERVINEPKRNIGEITLKKWENITFIIIDINDIITNYHNGDEHSMCSYFNINNLPFEDENDQLCRLIKRILQ